MSSDLGIPCSLWGGRCESLLAGYRPELQPIPQAKAFPAPPKAAAAAPPSGPADGSTTCEHRCITRKGTNQHIEMETCLDCNKVLKRMPKSSQATASTDAANAAPQASCVTTRSALREAQSVLLAQSNCQPKTSLIRDGKQKGSIAVLKLDAVNFTNSHLKADIQVANALGVD